jgi:hypothetical protein
MRSAFGFLRNADDAIRALQNLERDLSVALHWVGVVREDPDPVSPGDLWLRADLLQLRLRTKDKDDVCKTYMIDVTELVPEEA